MELELESDKCAMGKKVFVRGRKRRSEGRNWASWNPDMRHDMHTYQRCWKGGLQWLYSLKNFCCLR